MPWDTLRCIKETGLLSYGTYIPVGMEGGGRQQTAGVASESMA